MKIGPFNYKLRPNDFGANVVGSNIEIGVWVQEIGKSTRTQIFGSMFIGPKASGPMISYFGPMSSGPASSRPITSGPIVEILWTKYYRSKYIWSNVYIP